MYVAVRRSNFICRHKIAILAMKEDIQLFKRLLKIENTSFFVILIEFALVITTIIAFVDKSLHLYSIIAFLMALLLPYLFLKEKGILPFFRLTTVYLAFIPSFNPIVLTNAFKKGHAFSPAFSLNESLVLLSIFKKEMIGLIIVLSAICLVNHLKIQKSNIILAFLGTIFAFLMLILPAIADILLYLSSYLFIIATFFLFEKVFKLCTKKYEIIIMWCLVFTMFFRGIYHMLAILQMYPL